MSGTRFERRSVALGSAPLVVSCGGGGGGSEYPSSLKMSDGMLHVITALDVVGHDGYSA